MRRLLVLVLVLVPACATLRAADVGAAFCSAARTAVDVCAAVQQPPAPAPAPR